MTLREAHEQSQREVSKERGAFRWSKGEKGRSIERSQVGPVGSVKLYTKL